MWRKVLTPTLLVSLLWISIGGVTTFFIHWSTELQTRMLSENVATIRAVAQLQDVLLQLQALTASSPGPPAPATTRRLAALLDEFERDMAAAEKSAKTASEHRLLEQLRRQASVYLAPFRAWSQRRSPAEPAGVVPVARPDNLDELAASCRQLLQINEQLVSDSVAHRSSAERWLNPLRIAMMILGPLLGILCGVWIALGFRHSIARISVTLSSTETGAAQAVGHVTVTPAGDLPALQQQVEAVGVRIRTVVDQLHQARQQLVRSERLAAIGQLAAGVAHELRNPLTSVKLLIQTAARRGPAAALNEKQLWVIQEEIARMETTIQGLLDFARPPALDRSRHDLRETVQRAISLVEGRAKQQKVAVRPQFPEQPVVVDGDHAQLHQVFVNLLLNGIEAAGQGGTVEVSLHAAEPAGDCCRTVFRDSGKGLPEAVREHIFEPFVTSKEHGTGLGLAVSRRIVEEHGGTIGAANHPQGGAAFTVVLPRWAAEEETDHAQTAGH